MATTQWLDLEKIGFYLYSNNANGFVLKEIGQPVSDEIKTLLKDGGFTKITDGYTAPFSLISAYYLSRLAGVKPIEIPRQNTFLSFHDTRQAKTLDANPELTVSANAPVFDDPEIENFIDSLEIPGGHTNEPADTKISEPQENVPDQPEFGREPNTQPVYQEIYSSDEKVPDDPENTSLPTEDTDTREDSEAQSTDTANADSQENLPEDPSEHLLNINDIAVFTPYDTVLRETAIGVVTETIRSTIGDKGYHVLVSDKNNPGRIDRIWEEDFDIKPVDVGFAWESSLGEHKIVGKGEGLGGFPYFSVQDPTGISKNIFINDIGQEILHDTANLDFQNKYPGEQSTEQKTPVEEQTSGTTLHGFVHDIQEPRKSRILAALNKQQYYGGTLRIKKEAIEEFVENGWYVAFKKIGDREKRSLMHSEVSYFDNLTKTELDYADYLVGLKKDEIASLESKEIVQETPESLPEDPKTVEENPETIEEDPEQNDVRLAMGGKDLWDLDAKVLRVRQETDFETMEPIWLSRIKTLESLGERYGQTVEFRYSAHPTLAETEKDVIELHYKKEYLILSGKPAQDLTFKEERDLEAITGILTESGAMDQINHEEVIKTSSQDPSEKVDLWAVPFSVFSNTSIEANEFDLLPETKKAARKVFEEKYLPNIINVASNAITHDQKIQLNRKSDYLFKGETLKEVIEKIAIEQKVKITVEVDSCKIAIAESPYSKLKNILPEAVRYFVMIQKEVAFSYREILRQAQRQGKPVTCDEIKITDYMALLDSHMKFIDNNLWGSRETFKLFDTQKTIKIANKKRIPEVVTGKLVLFKDYPGFEFVLHEKPKPQNSISRGHIYILSEVKTGLAIYQSATDAEYEEKVIKKSLEKLKKATPELADLEKLISSKKHINVVEASDEILSGDDLQIENEPESGTENTETKASTPADAPLNDVDGGQEQNIVEPEQSDEPKLSFEDQKQVLRQAYLNRGYTLYFRPTEGSWNLTIKDERFIGAHKMTPGEVRLSQDKEKFVEIENCIGALEKLISQSINKSLWEMTLDDFLNSGHQAHEVTRAQWVDIQRRHRRSLGQSETDGPPAAPYSAYEIFHENAVKDAFKRSFEIPENVLADYPDLTAKKTGKPAVLNYKDQVGGGANKYIGKLFNELGIAQEIVDNEEYYRRVLNEPYMPLVIEKHFNEIFLTHYYEQNGDHVMDTEMVFYLDDRSGRLRLKETAVQNTVRGGELRSYDKSFANMFAKNLVQQGFGQGKIIDPRAESEAAETEKDIANEAPVQKDSDPDIEDEKIIKKAGGYLKIISDPKTRDEFQDILDSFFNRRIIDVRNALRELGWEGDIYKTLSKNGIVANLVTTTAGSGNNVVGYSYNGIMDDLSKSISEYAAIVDATSNPDPTDKTIKDPFWAPDNLPEDIRNLMKEVIVRPVIGGLSMKAPLNVREGGHLIMNAPRPIAGDPEKIWNDDFNHGRFYTAIDPVSEFAKQNIEENRKLDAWLIAFITEQNVVDYFKRGKYADKIEGVDQEDLNEMFYNQLDKLTYPEFLEKFNHPAGMVEKNPSDGMNPMEETPEGWTAQKTTLGITYTKTMGEDTIGIEVTPRDDGSFNIEKVSNGGATRENQSIANDEKNANRIALEMMGQVDQKSILPTENLPFGWGVGSDGPGQFFVLKNGLRINDKENPTMEDAHAEALIASKNVDPVRLEQEEPWQITQIKFFTYMRDIKIDGSVSTSTGKPIYQYSTIVDWDGNQRVFNINTKNPLNGNSMIEKLHKEMIIQAISENKPVPSEALADYPDLKPEPALTPELAANPSVGEEGYSAWYDTKAQAETAMQSMKANGLSPEYVNEAYYSESKTFKFKIYRSQEENDRLNAEFRAEQEEMDRLKKEKEDAIRAEYEEVNGFADSMDPMNKGKALKALNVLTRIDGQVVTRKKMLENLVEAGATTNTREENKIKPMSRRAYFSADQREQEAHEKRMREAGSKTVYMITNPGGGSGSFYEIAKTEYDYTNFLIGKKATPDTTDPEETRVQKEAWQIPLSEWGERNSDRYNLDEYKKDPIWQGYTLYVTVKRPLEQGRYQLEAYDVETNKQIATSSAYTGPTSISFKLNNRKDKYNPFDSAVYEIEKDQKFSYEWYVKTRDDISAANHKECIKQALRMGKKVPQDVLKDYPDFVKKIESDSRPKPKNFIGTNENGQDLFSDETGNRYYFQEFKRKAAPKAFTMDGSLKEYSTEELFEQGKTVFLTIEEIEEFETVQAENSRVVM